MNIPWPVTEDRPPAASRRDLDGMDYERIARGVIAFHPAIETVGPLLERARLEISGIAGVETVLDVYAHNPDSLFALSRTSGEVEALREPSGFIAQLPLNEHGTQALLSGALDTAAPDLAYVCRQHERPSAIYIWAIFVNHRLSGAIALIMERLSSEKNRSAPLFCKATSEKSRKFFETLGFRSDVVWQGELIPDLLHYPRTGAVVERTFSVTPNRSGERAAYDTVESPEPVIVAADQIRITVAHQLDDLMKVFAIRAATYVREHGCPYDEEFDGNDFTASQLLGYVGNEPVGCLRIRYFADFAKLERLAVREGYRNTKLAFQLIRAGIELCRKKGYRRLYGHAEEHLVKLWQRFGFRPRTAQATFAFSDHVFVEGDLELNPHPAALTPFTDPYILLRPEGQWNRPGILDRSSKRYRKK